MRRRKLRTRVQPEVVTAEEPASENARVGPFRSRQRALQGGEDSPGKGPGRGRARTRGRRPGAGAGAPGTRGQGRQRVTSPRRFPARSRPRRPVYYYDDYYYDPAYEEDYYGYDYEDYELAPPKPQGKFKSNPLTAEPSPELPDIGGEDYGGLIKVVINSIAIAYSNIRKRFKDLCFGFERFSLKKLKRSPLKKTM